jgi:23S rRNA (guanosine2251-2'-O)-methyltransferase
MDGVDYKSFKYPEKVAVVIGNEGSGLSRIVRESCDEIIKIPMYGKVNSLNASVATGIVIYEVINR